MQRFMSWMDEKLSQPVGRVVFALLVLCLVVASLLLRVHYFPQTNFDMTTFNLRWLRVIQQQSPRHYLGAQFTNYFPGYIYLLMATQVIPGLKTLDSLTVLKIIPVFFDYVAAGFVFLIIQQVVNKRWLACLAAIAFLFLPTVFLNSAYWGQVDVLYTLCILMGAYFLIKEKPVFSMLAFGLGFVFKLQTVFVLPVLLVLLMVRRYRWWHLVLLPLPLAGAFTPQFFFGYTLKDAYNLFYMLTFGGGERAQSGMTLNCANLYSIIPLENTAMNKWIAFGITALALAGFIVLGVRLLRRYSPRKLMVLFFAGLMVVPFFLPQMHERYFYPAEVFALLLMFAFPSVWSSTVLVLLQIATVSVYKNFLRLNIVGLDFFYAGMINMIILLVVIMKMSSTSRENEFENSRSPYVDGNDST